MHGVPPQFNADVKEEAFFFFFFFKWMVAPKSNQCAHLFNSGSHAIPWSTEANAAGIHPTFIHTTFDSSPSNQVHVSLSVGSAFGPVSDRKISKKIKYLMILSTGILHLLLKLFFI